MFILLALKMRLCLHEEQLKGESPIQLASGPIVHEIIMLIFGVLLQGLTVLVDRTFPCWSANALKFIRFGLHAIVASFMLCGLVWIYMDKGGPFTKDHLRTWHSRAGIISFFWFLAQLAVGAVTLLPPLLPVKIRDVFMAFHKAIGWFIYVATCATTLLGINSIERKHYSHRGYHVDNSTKLEVRVRFASLFLLLHVMIMLYLILAPKFKRQQRHGAYNNFAAQTQHVETRT